MFATGSGLRRRSPPKPMSMPPPLLSSCKPIRKRTKRKTNMAINAVVPQLKIMHLLSISLALVLLLSASACGQQRSNIVNCPRGSEIKCRDAACYRTCEEALLLGECRKHEFICKSTDYVCDCYNSWGFYRRNATSTECIRINDPDCRAARAKVCGENKQAMCNGYDNNCRPRTCFDYYTIRHRKNENLCVWTKKDLDLYCPKKSQTCVCSNGYFYDIPTKKCVLPNDCTPYWWDNLEVECNKDPPLEMIVVTGQDVHDGQVIVMRYNESDDTTLLGKLRYLYTTYAPAWPITVAKDKEFCVWTDRDMYKKVEVLYALPGAIKWQHHKSCDGDKVPDNALVAGYINSRPQYIGKANLEDNKLYSTPGRVENGKLSIGYNGRIFTYDDFEVAYVNPNFPNEDDQMSWYLANVYRFVFKAPNAK